MDGRSSRRKLRTTASSSNLRSGHKAPLNRADSWSVGGGQAPSGSHANSSFRGQGSPCGRHVYPGNGKQISSPHPSLVHVAMGKEGKIGCSEEDSGIDCRSFSPAQDNESHVATQTSHFYHSNGSLLSASVPANSYFVQHRFESRLPADSDEEPQRLRPRSPTIHPMREDQMLVPGCGLLSDMLPRHTAKRANSDSISMQSDGSISPGSRRVHRLSSTPDLSPPVSPQDEPKAPMSRFQRRFSSSAKSKSKKSNWRSLENLPNEDTDGQPELIDKDSRSLAGSDSPPLSKGKRLFSFADPRRFIKKRYSERQSSAMATMSRQGSKHGNEKGVSKLRPSTSTTSLGEASSNNSTTVSSERAAHGNAEHGGSQHRQPLASSNNDTLDGVSRHPVQTNGEDTPPPVATSSWRNLLNMRRKLSPIEVLFEAIERHDYEQVEEVIITTPALDLNETNAEDHTPLDVAVMTNMTHIARLIMRHGGQENTIFIKNRYFRSVRLTTLVTEAEEHVDRLTSLVVSAGTNAQSAPSSSKLKEYERQLRDWEWRCHTLRRMLAIYDKARPPDPPKLVRLSVQSSTSLRVDFDEPEETNGAIVTRYKIIWSETADFKVSTEAVKTDLRDLRYIITGLREGVTYHVAVEAFNMQGYSSQKLSIPSCATPSGWRMAVTEELRDRAATSSAAQQILHALSQDVLEQDTDDVLDSKGLKRNWFKLFGAKFTHTLEPRSLYLAVLFFTEDSRILVTMDGHLPMLLVDEEYNAAQHSADLQWFNKLAVTWRDTRQLKELLAGGQSSATIAFRYKLLLAVIQAQLSLSQVDLGQIHHEVFSDFSSCSVILTARQVQKSNSTSASMRWVPVTRFLRKRTDRPMTPTAGEKSEHLTPQSTPIASRADQTSPTMASEVYTHIIQQVPDVMNFYRDCHTPPPRGLYVGLVKFRTMVSSLSVFVSRAHPLLPPYFKISDNPNVSRDEWLWLQKIQAGNSGRPSLPEEAVQHGRNIQQKIARGAVRLLNRFGLDESEEDVFASYRIYTKEVIEVSPDVSLILLLPQPDAICLAPGQSHSLEDHSGVLCVPLGFFQIAQLAVFRPSFMDLFSRLAASLDCHVLMRQQQSRQAFSKEEVSSAQQDVETSAKQVQDLEGLWKETQWLTDVLSVGRERSQQVGVTLREMFANSLSAGEILPPTQKRGLRRGQPRKGQSNSSWSSSSINSAHRRQKSAHSEHSLTANRVSDANSGGPERRQFKTGVSSGRRGSLPSTYSEHSWPSRHTHTSEVRAPAEEAPAPPSSSAGASSAGTNAGTNSLLRQPKPPFGPLQHQSLNRLTVHHSLPRNYPAIGMEGQYTRTTTAVLKGLLRVYSAYETGLPKGTSVRLEVSAQTTASEVVYLVTQELARRSLHEMQHRGVDASTNELLNTDSSSFCLVAIVDGRDRPLPDDFCLLDLESMWAREHLYIRQRSPVEQALQQGQSTSV